MSDNIKFSFMAPGASEYQVEYNPRMDLWFEHLHESHVLGSGQTKYFHKGYKFHGNLFWQQPLFFRGDQYDRLRQIFNLHAGMTLYPAPESAPGASFAVRWVNDLDFHLVAGVTPIGYEGMMVIEGTSILTQINEYIVMGLG
ncbi:hypothetical protein KKB18_04895 [bacterium]|nr:hypothetical protein [bacterium]